MALASSPQRHSLIQVKKGAYENKAHGERLTSEKEQRIDDPDKLADITPEPDGDRSDQQAKKSKTSRWMSNLDTQMSWQHG